MDKTVNNVRVDKICIDGLVKSLIILSPGEKGDFDTIFKILENSELIWRDNYAPASSMVDWYVSERTERKETAIEKIFEYFLQIAPDVYSDEKDLYGETVKPQISNKIRTWFNI